MSDPSYRKIAHCYIFFREGGFYPVMLHSDEEARRSAEANAGTVRVETQTGFVIWRSAAAPQLGERE